MAFGAHRDNYYQGLAWPSVVKQVRGLVTSTTQLSVWTPASGKKFRLLGGDLTVHIGVATALAVGDFIHLYDNAVTAGVYCLGIAHDAAQVAGGIFGTTLMADTTFESALTEPYGAGTQKFDFHQKFDIPGGYTSAAADQVLKCGVGLAADGTAVDVSTGKIWIIGTVWGHEV